LKRMVVSDKVIKIKAQGKMEKLLFDLKKLPAVKGVELKDEELKIIASEKIALNELLNKVLADNVSVKNIVVEEPTLEEVFLTLTGKKLRDGEE
ncbi:MAG: DUF4162 domain-containing protein, partial [Bacillota bacterium]|nr:DUF4162 domain-containing protein [Bacillota bacterium]